MRDLEFFQSCLRDLSSFSAFNSISTPSNRSRLNGIQKYVATNNSNNNIIRTQVLLAAAVAGRHSDAGLLRTRRRRRFNPFFNLNEIKFRIKYRFSKENVRKIIEIVRDDLEIEHNQQMKSGKELQVPVDLQIMAALRYWGGTEHPEITAAVHGISLRTLTKISRRVAAALSSKASRYIRMPTTLSEKELVLRSFQDLANMPQVIGAVVHFSIRYKYKSKVNNNKCTPQDAEDDTDEAADIDASADDYISIQVVCDAAHKIRDLDLRLCCDELDSISEIFTQSRIKERFAQNEFRGRLLLGNEALSCTPFLFTPVQYPKRECDELYNRVHAATYAPAANCIRLWLKRFGILNSELCNSFGSAKHFLTALALLHNMAMEWNDTSLGLDNNGVQSDGMLMNLHNFCLDAPVGDERARRDFIKLNF